MQVDRQTGSQTDILIIILCTPLSGGVKVLTRNIWKMLGPFATASRRTPPVLHCHSPGVATVARRHCRTPPAHRCPRRRRRQQRQRVTEGTAMASYNGPKYYCSHTRWNCGSERSGSIRSPRSSVPARYASCATRHIVSQTQASTSQRVSRPNVDWPRRSRTFAYCRVFSRPDLSGKDWNLIR